jgi:uncharacterized membrane protein
MDLIVLVVVLVLIGFLVWVLTNSVPLPPFWARAIQLTALIMVILYLLTRVVSIPNVLR